MDSQTLQRANELSRIIASHKTLLKELRGASLYFRYSPACSGSIKDICGLSEELHEEILGRIIKAVEAELVSLTKEFEEL